jgi:hypothetical protein
VPIESTACKLAIFRAGLQKYVSLACWENVSESNPWVQFCHQGYCNGRVKMGFGRNIVPIFSHSPLNPFDTLISYAFHEIDVRLTLAMYEHSIPWMASKAGHIG